MESLQWAIGVLVTILIAVMSWFASQLWGHVMECRQVMARLEGLSKDIERMKEDIGTHDTGMRGHIHETAQLTQQHELRIAALEHR